MPADMIVKLAFDAVGSLEQRCAPLSAQLFLLFAKQRRRRKHNRLALLLVVVAALAILLFLLRRFQCPLPLLLRQGLSLPVAFDPHIVLVVQAFQQVVEVVKLHLGAQPQHADPRPSNAHCSPTRGRCLLDLAGPVHGDAVAVGSEAGFGPRASKLDCLLQHLPAFPDQQLQHIAVTPCGLLCYDGVLEHGKTVDELRNLLAAQVDACLFQLFRSSTPRSLRTPRTRNLQVLRRTEAEAHVQDLAHLELEALGCFFPRPRHGSMVRGIAIHRVQYAGEILSQLLLVVASSLEQLHTLFEALLEHAPRPPPLLCDRLRLVRDPRRDNLEQDLEREHGQRACQTPDTCEVRELHASVAELLGERVLLDLEQLLARLVQQKRPVRVHLVDLRHRHLPHRVAVQPMQLLQRRLCSRENQTGDIAHRNTMQEAIQVG
mmetsp:Transcript_60165/g.141990  ORF Transcript_60165/g.141990 Transcript_60165/m.141990 type:complete len:432 (-) Transcript_60165:968-2263(-)